MRNVTQHQSPSEIRRHLDTLFGRGRPFPLPIVPSAPTIIQKFLIGSLCGGERSNTIAWVVISDKKTRVKIESEWTNAETNLSHTKIRPNDGVVSTEHNKKFAPQVTQISRTDIDFCRF